MTCVPESSDVRLIQDNDNLESIPESQINTLDPADLTGSGRIPARAFCSPPGSQLVSEPGHIHDVPQNAPLPRDPTNLQVIFLDKDEEEATKSLEWIPKALEVFGPYPPCVDQINWLSTLNSYFMFGTRYVYESSNLLEAIRILSESYGWVDSARLGLLGTAVLFHSYTDSLAPRSILQERSRQFIHAATTSMQLEMTQPGMPVRASLAGISVILLYHYYSGDLGAYARCLEAAVPMVKAVVGASPVKFHRLSGAQTIDIRSFVWCDIFTAIAASRPTRLVYDCNAEELLRQNQAGPNPVDMDVNIGLEWMCGLPDAMLMLIIQIINLRHSSRSHAERLVHATRIEKALRDWKVWPSKTTNSIMRIQRMGAQEIWRCFAILYLYQAIHQASPSHEVVRRCVSQIFKLGSMLRPGHNPDCLLNVPYFVAGTFATLVKHKQFFTARLLGCSMEAYGQKLAKALEELWQKSLDTGKHNDWTTRTSPVVIFS